MTITGLPISRRYYNKRTYSKVCGSCYFAGKHKMANSHGESSDYTVQIRVP